MEPAVPGGIDLHYLHERERGGCPPNSRVIARGWDRFPGQRKGVARRVEPKEWREKRNGAARLDNGKVATRRVTTLYSCLQDRGENSGWPSSGQEGGGAYLDLPKKLERGKRRRSSTLTDERKKGGPARKRKEAGDLVQLEYRGGIFRGGGPASLAPVLPAEGKGKKVPFLYRSRERTGGDPENVGPRKGGERCRSSFISKMHSASTSTGKAGKRVNTNRQIQKVGTG